MTYHVIEREDGSLVVQGYTHGAPSNSIGVVPSDIAMEDWGYLKATNTVDPSTSMPIKVITVDATVKNAALGVSTKKANISAAYQTMSDEVDEKMYEVFRTLKPEYASAEYETWQDMVNRPIAYASLGLKTDHQINNADGSELFSPGSALDTAQKITDYAARKIVLAQEYGTYRVQRIQQFKNAKAAIENS